MVVKSAMDAVRNGLRASTSWLPSGNALWNLTIFDSLSVPFTDSSPSVPVQRQYASPPSDPASTRIVYLDHNGRQLRQEEVESFEVVNFQDTPWGFIASRYALTLGVMAVVVNRISHICRPQGRPRPLSTHRRLAIQIPTLAFLTFSGSMLLLITLDSFAPGNKPVKAILSSAWLPHDVLTLLTSNQSEDAVRAANSSLLWRLFLSVCFAVISSTLLRTLEGHNTIVNPDDLGNSPTFNLVGFAVLLHLHASSFTFPPNKHVYLSILFQVCEVLGLQACTCWPTPPVSRLTLTTVVGITSTIHYLVATYSGDRGYPLLQSFSRAPDVAIIAVIALTLSLHALTALITGTALSFDRLLDPRSMPNPSDDYSLALFKLGTACLNATRLSGLDSDLVDIRTSTEPWIEIEGAEVRVRERDGSVAKIESASNTGFYNEIRRVRTTKSDPQRQSYFNSPLWHQRWTFCSTLFSTIRGLSKAVLQRLVRILPFHIPALRLPQWAQDLPRRMRLLWHGTNGEAQRQHRIEEERQRQKSRDRIAAADRARRDRLEGAGRALSASASTTATAQNGNAIDLRKRATSPQSFAPLPNSWHRYFQQEFADEGDDDEEWVEEAATHQQRERTTSPMPAGETAGYWQSLDNGARLINDEGDVDDDLEDSGDEAMALGDDEQADLSGELLALARRDFGEGTDDTDDADTYTRVLMAHMASGRNGILTRRGYQQIANANAQASDDAQLLAQVIRERRNVSDARSDAVGSLERERMRLCVICYIEERTIICWPCKCLALCDGCREAMAARPPPRSAGDFGGGDGGAGHRRGSTSTHTCPTCRTPVIGFSRIFLP